MTVKDILDLSTDDIDIYDVNNTDDRMVTINRIAYKKRNGFGKNSEFRSS